LEFVVLVKLLHLHKVGESLGDSRRELKQPFPLILLSIAQTQLLWLLLLSFPNGSRVFQVVFNPGVASEVFIVVISLNLLEKTQQAGIGPGFSHMLDQRKKEVVSDKHEVYLLGIYLVFPAFDGVGDTPCQTPNPKSALKYLHR